jgi:hypothetical protein
MADLAVFIALSHSLSASLLTMEVPYCMEKKGDRARWAGIYRQAADCYLAGYRALRQQNPNEIK